MTFIPTLLNQEPEVRALALNLRIKYSEAEDLIQMGDYLVLNGEERKDSIQERIHELLWAFNYSFLANQSKVIRAIPEKVWDMMRETMYEDLNGVILEALGHNTYGLVYDAIVEDGYGHFLAQYDGEELEQEVSGNTYYIYRVN